MLLNSHRKRGFSLIELLVVVAIILIVASIAVPNLMRARRSANEASSVASLRAIASGQLVYRHSEGIYTTLAALGTEKIIDDVLANGNKSGYVFTSMPGTDPANEFTAEAHPNIASGPMSTGSRYFFISQDQVIRFSTSGAATSASSPLTD